MKSLLDQVTAIIIKLGIYVICYKHKFSSSIITSIIKLIVSLKGWTLSPQQITLLENHASNSGKSFSH